MLNYRNIFDSGMSYSTYREVIYLLMQKGETTGSDHSESMLHYTKMNNQRMNRIENTAVLTTEILDAIAKVKGKYNLLIISEGWCGDAAQIVPVIDKIVSAAPAKFSLKFVFRDENLPLIDAHLTNGGRAIPVLLVLDENYNLVLPKWGPRPAVLQALLKEWKSEIEDAGLVAEKLHGWYAKDKTISTQAELVAVLKQLT